jgi:hypothetical protein
MPAPAALYLNLGERDALPVVRALEGLGYLPPGEIEAGAGAAAGAGRMGAVVLAAPGQVLGRLLALPQLEAAPPPGRFWLAGMFWGRVWLGQLEVEPRRDLPGVN